MVGQLLGRYRVLEKIGAGGMGVVYRAHDLRLDRDVALKVLPAGTLGDDAARKRFRNEALALSKLNHPNIETVHDFDTQEGTDFLVMEFIPGVTLGDKLVGGPLPEKEIMRLGTQLAEGLAAAHEHSIVHRDLKPGNLRLTPDGRLKILDFGLAKLLRPFSDAAATESVAETRSVSGTLPYMAPEQLRGEPADARTDIYAAGVVLYEMATGQRPFREELTPRLTDAILHTPTPPPGRLKPDLSPRLEEVILKCLEKEPENRYQSARELCVDLRRLSAAEPQTTRGREPAATRRPRRAAAKRIRSLAVLPLENLSRDPEQEYFADGMTEALITDLAKISALKVISRTSAMRFKGTDKPLPVIARELNVDAVVEGSVLRAGDRVRITAQLIHAATDEHLWAESYQRELCDVLDLQSEVARAIAEEIKIKLTPREQAQLARKRPVNPAAHDAYLKGNFYWSKWTQEGFRKGVEYFQRAIEEDPTHAPAYAGLGHCHVFLGYWGHVDPREAYPKAKAAALKALELDDTLADAHCALAAVRWFHDWDLPSAESELKRALELNRNDAAAHTWYAVFLSVIKNDSEKALAEARRAQELDPLSAFVNACYGWICFWACQYDRAVEICRKLLEIDPKAEQAYRVMGNCALTQSRLEEAIAAFEKAMSLSRDAVSMAFLGAAYGMSGQADKARALLHELEARAEREYVSPMAFIWLHLGLGEREKMFEWVEKAFEQRETMLFWLRFFPGMLDEPRMQDFLRRLVAPA